jgi:transposase
MDINVKRLDHLGVVAGVMHEHDFINTANTLLGTDIQEIVTSGEASMAMIINGLGFTSKPLTLTPHFFKTKPLDILIGTGVPVEALNRYKLGRVLDSIFEYGCEKFFNQIALPICIKEEIDLSHAFGDTSSFEVEGNYDNQEECASVTITHGYSKARRPDLKQILLELCSSSDGNVPFVMRPWSGNKSDNKIFHERVMALREASKSSGNGVTLVADAKLYTAENVKALEGMYFITRVPSTIKRERECVTNALQKSEWIPALNGYKYTVYDLEHYGTHQRWIVYFSEHSYDRSKKTLEKQLKKAETKLTKAILALQKKRFVSRDDANLACEKLFKQHVYHNFSIDACNETLKHTSRGRPSAKATKTTDYFTICVSFARNEEIIKKELDQCACFVLAASAPESLLPSEDVLTKYKELDCVEKGFAFLKTPKFFTEAFFIKSAERIQAMLVIMTLALLFYMVAQRRMRKVLAETKSTIPNQICKPTAHPTLRWVFQCLEGIDVVSIFTRSGPVESLITGIDVLKERMLSLFGDWVMRIYRLSRHTGETL